MNFQQIKDALKDGKKVFWKNENHQVKDDIMCGLIIKFIPTKYCTGLCVAGTNTLIEDQELFFIKD